MLKSELSTTIINNCLKEQNYDLLAKYLGQFFIIKRNESGLPLQYEFSEDILESLHKILGKVIARNMNEDQHELLHQLFRCLRNYVINPQVQNYLTKDNVFLKDVKALLLKLENKVKIILQFLNNLIISNETAALRVYSILYPEIVVFFKENVCVYEVTALLYNINLFKRIDMDYEMYLCFFNLYQRGIDTEFLHFLLDQNLCYDHFWNNYQTFDLKYRLIVLGIIRQKQIDGEPLNIPEYGIKMLIESFVNSGDIIFQTSSNNDSNLQPYEVSLLLEVISSLSSNEDCLKVLQNDKNLLIHSGVLLINIHRLGKESDNCFTPIQNLSEVREPNAVISQHPAFGFKGDLIRIIGNLCWKCKVMQDLAREAELVSVILDCCNMDARNPFILQWVILAIRNLCENNLDNQGIVAGLHQQGEVSSATLEEMGLTIHSGSDNTLKMVSLDALRNRK